MGQRSDCVWANLRHGALRCQIARPQPPAGLAGHLVLELSRGYADGLDPQAATADFDAECLTRASGSPDAEEQRHAGEAQGRVGVGEEVFGDEEGEALEEALGDMVVRGEGGEGAAGGGAVEGEGGNVAGGDVGVDAQDLALEAAVLGPGFLC